MIKKYTINKICVTSVSLFLILMFYLVPSTPESEVKIDKSIGDKKEVVVYLMDKDYYLGRMIEYASYDNIVDLVNKKLDILINGSDELNSFSPIIPKNTKVNSIKVDKNNIYIDFSKDILNVSKYNEELMIESIIYTITDINGIDNIYLSINKEPLKILPKSNKEIPYPLNRGYGINKKYDLDSLNNITKTTVYFNKSYDDVEYLVPITKVMNTTSEKIDIIIEELKSIVNAQYNLNSYIPNNLEVVSHDVNDDKMNLIFNEFILDKEKLVVLEEVKYAIAQSIFDNYNVKEDISYVSNTKNYNIEFYANMIKKGIIQDKDVFNYNLALKSKFIYETVDEFTTELDNEDMLHLFKDIEMPLVRVLAKMEMNGIRVDTDTLDIIKNKLEEKLNVLSSKIYDLAGIEFNISSPKQLGEILFEKMDLPHKAKKGRNGYSTNHDTLMKLYDLHPIIPLILEYRNLIKLMTTYMNNLKDYVMSDSKIHTIFKQTITRTGRLSSAEPNLQNIPIRTEEGKEIRKAFLPEEDSVILTSDYSQIELRILAHISGCKNLISAFNNSEDIHTKVASDIYGVDASLVTKTMRRTAKAVIFGIVYGISGFGLGENLDISPKEAKKYIDKYLTMYPGVKEYMDNIKMKAKEQGYVRTIMNRKREIDELKNTNYIIVKSGERMAMNTPIQGSAADIIKKAMIDVDNEMAKKGLKSKMLIQVHDELVFTVPKDEIEIMKELVRDTMENAYNLEVPLKVDVELGSNWYDAK